MDFLNEIFLGDHAMQTLAVIFFIIASGLLLGRIKIGGISFGATFVFFCGIIGGHLGIHTNTEMALFAQNFGLVIFVYALGVQVGPGFFNSFKRSGLSLNLLGLGVILIGTALSIACSFLLNVSLPDMIGILCGATTNTPALGAAQQTLEQFGLDSAGPALSCAVTYPLGVAGVILAMVILRSLPVRHSKSKDGSDRDEDDTDIAAFTINNPAIFGKSVPEIARMTSGKFIISRIWRKNKVIIPDSSCLLRENDRILVVFSPEQEKALTSLFGTKEAKDWRKEGIDWNAIDPNLISRWIVVTRPEINGKSIGSLKLRNRFRINISRVARSGVMLLATSDLVLSTGDRLVVVGRDNDIEKVANLLGNAVRNLREPNLVSICIGIVLGLILGAIPLFLPGISAPVKLGLAGGPIIVGILMGAFGPRIHMVTYTTESANLMLRRLGLSMYLACLGLSSGARFFETVFRPEGLLWIGLGFAITVIPVLIIGLVSMKILHLDFGTVSGMLCGSMSNPMALTYATENTKNNHAAVSYTQVYPFSMFMRVIIAQLALVFLL